MFWVNDQFDADCRALGVNIPFSEVDVNAAFRRKAHSLHPDRNRTEDSHAAFCELSDARDRVIDGIQAGTSRSPSVLLQMIEALRWLNVSGGALTLIEMLPRALDAAGLVEAHALARDIVCSKIVRQIRTVRLTATLRNLLDGDVYVWRGDRTVFVPLWHDTLYFDDKRLMFVVTRDLPENVTVEENGDILATVQPGESLVVEGKAYEIGVHVGAPIPNDEVYETERGIMRVVAAP